MSQSSSSYYTDISAPGQTGGLYFTEYSGPEQHNQNLVDEFQKQQPQAPTSFSKAQVQQHAVLQQHMDAQIQQQQQQIPTPIPDMAKSSMELPSQPFFQPPPIRFNTDSGDPQSTPIAVESFTLQQNDEITPLNLNKDDDENHADPIAWIKKNWTPLAVIVIIIILIATWKSCGGNGSVSTSSASVVPTTSVSVMPTTTASTFGPSLSELEYL